MMVLYMLSRQRLTFTKIVDFGGIKGNFQCDYVELEENDTLVFEYKFPYEDTRNIQFPPYWKFATAVVK